MTQNKFLIAPYKDGLNEALEPWLLANDAFAELTDAYIYQGRVKRKKGYSLLGRLQRTPDQVTIPYTFILQTDGTGTYTNTLTNGPFAPGSIEISVATVPATVFTDNGNGTLSSTTADINYGIVDYETGVFTLYFDPVVAALTNVTVTACNAVDRLPAMGLSLYEQSTINEEFLIAFDTDRSYDWSYTTDDFEDVSFYKMTAPANAVAWTGSDSDFFWTSNYEDVLWATNNISGMHNRAITNITNAAAAVITVGAGHGFIVNDVVFINEVTGMTQINGLTGTVTATAAATITVNINSAAFGAYAANGQVFALTQTISGDGIRYYDGFGAGLGWRNFSSYLQETVVAPTYLVGCLAILPFKDRLVCFNTVEQSVAGAATRYPQRVRWSQNGTVFYATTNTPTATGARAGSQWAEDIPGKGGYLEAPTNEQITSVAYYRDTLIVYFERSTWQLKYTGSEVLPFIFEQINSELGSESTFSPIRFDKGVMAIGDKAITATNAISVERLDEKIPRQIFRIENDDDGVKRVHGIRDFFNEYSYWAYTDSSSGRKFPNHVLALNYEEGTWAIFRDSFTCYGTWQNNTDYTWATLPYDSWASWTSPWNTGLTQAFFPNIIAGNQKGQVVLLDNTSIENGISLDMGVTIPLPWTISATNPAVVNITDHNLESGQFVKFWWTRAFPNAVVGEASGTAELGSVAFTGTLENLGIFTGTLFVTITGVATLQDLGNGTLASATAGVSGGINYETGEFNLAYPALVADAAVTVNYTYNDLNFRVFKINRLTDGTFSIYFIDADGNEQAYDATAYIDYAEYGAIAVLNNFNIKSKRFNPFVGDSSSVRISYVEMFMEATDSATFSVDVNVDESEGEPITTLTVPTNNVKNPGVTNQKNWQRVFINSVGNFLQLEMYLSNLEMIDEDSYAADWVLHGTILDIQPSGEL